MRRQHIFKRLRGAAAALAGLALAACGQSATEAPPPASPAPAAEAAGLAPAAADQASAFEYYMLALSWSPAYCAESRNAERDALQCGSGRPYAFVVHGLWPQRGAAGGGEGPRFLQFCGGEDAPNAPDEIVQAQLDLMPAEGLIRHQWRKHGTCTGLDPAGYFAKQRDLREALRIPAAYQAIERPLRVEARAMRAAFVAANQGLPEDGLTITCRGGRLREVRVCFSKDGAFRSCGADARDSCPAGAVTMLPTRPTPRRG